MGFRKLAGLLAYTFWGKAASGVANNMDAVLVARFLGPELAPVLLLTKKAPGLSEMFLTRPSTAFMPAISNYYGAGEREGTRSVILRLLNIILWILGGAIVGFVLLNEVFVSLWVGNSLYGGDVVNGLIIVGLAVSVLTVSLSNICYALGNIKGNSLALFTQSLLSIPLMILGAKHFGMLGVAGAPILSAIAVASWYYPFILVRMLKITKNECFSVVLEVFKVSCAVVVSLMFFGSLQPQGWGMFAVFVLGISMVYATILTLLSRDVQMELVQAVQWVRLNLRLLN